MSQADMLSINAVAAKLGLSVHQLRRWELMFGLEIKRGRGQQRQYRSEDMSVLERIKELVEQGWPTSQIRPQLEAEGLVTPKLIGLPPPPGNPEVLSEALIGFRNFTERRFIEISRQIDELRQLLISITLKQELQGEPSSPWQPVQREFAPEPKAAPPQEISIGPDFSVGPPVEFTPPPPPPPPPQRTSIIGAPAQPKESTFEVGPSSGSFSTSGFSSTPGAAPERRSIIGEPNAPPPGPPTSPSGGMTEEEADALIEEEDLEEEIAEDKEEAAALPSAPSDEARPQPSLDAEDEEEDEEQEAPVASAPTITPITPSSVLMPTSPPPPAPPVISSDAFSPVAGSESTASSEPPAPPLPPADPFKSSPFLSTPPAPPPAPEPAAPPPPEPEAVKPSESTSSSSFAPAPPTLTPSAAADMFTSVVQSAADTARETAPEPPAPTPPEPSYASAPPPAPPPPPPTPGPSGTPFTPPAPESSPFIPTPPSTSSSPFLTPPPQPYVTGPAPTPPGQPFEPPVPPAPPEPEPAPPAPPEPPKAPAPAAQKGPFLGEITDQNYLTILGRALDLVGWSDEQADSFSVSRFKVPHWDELGRSQAEVLIEHLLAELQSQMSSEG